MTNTIEKQAAEQFAENMKKYNVYCDFSLLSLLVDIDLILNNEAIFNKQSNLPDPIKQQAYKNEAGLGAYIGESVCRLYQGTWKGVFNPNNAAFNYYTSAVIFGDYAFYPTHFISYHISNNKPGEQSEGTFADYLLRTLPFITQEQAPKRADQSNTFYHKIKHLTCSAPNSNEAP